MYWFHTLMAVLNIAFLIWCSFYVLKTCGAQRLEPEPRRKLVIFDSNVSSIVGKPTRAQWRLRRRSLMAAVAICDEYAEKMSIEGDYSAVGHASHCGVKILDLVDEFDRECPEFAATSRAFAKADKVA